MSASAKPQLNASIDEGNTPIVGRGGGWSWLAALLVCGLVVVPVLKNWVGAERERWDVAAANLLYESGQKELAITKLVSIAQGPRASDITKLELANYLLDAGRAEEAINWTEGLRDKLPADARELTITDGDSHSQVLQAHFRALLGNGRTQDACDLLRFWFEARDRNYDNSDLWTNGYAYQCALAKYDLEGADQRMKALFESRGAGRGFGRITWILPYQLKVLAATALVAVELKDPVEIEPLKRLLDEKIGNLDDQYQQANGRLRKFGWLAVNDGSITKDGTDSRLESLRFQAELERRSLAVLLAVRALLDQRVGDQKAVEDAAERLSKLDLKLQEMIDVLPPFFSCLDLIEEGAAFLDTHGWVLFQLEQLSEAFDLIDLAIISNRIAAQGYEQGDFLMGRSQKSIKDYFESRRRQTGTLLSHRYQIFVVTGDTVAAEEDARAIEELGFRVDDPRFF
ncbi:MAG: hypothetical protein KF851_06735 [Pirellulaceae bacterium]|nr:hypothetical protein [Pirellulaceae bacterium]